MSCLTLVVSACGLKWSTLESTPDGAPNLTGEGAANQSTMRQQISDALKKGLSGYRLSPGDVLEVLYLSSNQPQPMEYVIGLADRLRIEFHYIDEPARTLVVRPDGRITLPLKGEVIAAGLTPVQLASYLQTLYGDIYRDPKISVLVEQFTSKIDDLRVSLSNPQRGRSQRVVLSPDGLAYLPYLTGLQLSGLTVDEARELVNKHYAKQFGNLEVSVVIDTVVGNRVFVFGEVARPGTVQLNGPITVLQALASAGGHLPTGTLSNVKVLYWNGQESEPRLRTIDLAQVMEGQHVDENLVLPPNSTIYVPPTGITAANRFIDQFLRQLFLFNGTSIAFQRNL